MIRVGFVLGASFLGSINYYRNLLTAISQLPDPEIQPILFVGEAFDESQLTGFPNIDVHKSRWFDRLSPRWIAHKSLLSLGSPDPLFSRFLRQERINILSHGDPVRATKDFASLCWIPDFQHTKLPEFFGRSEIRYRDRKFRQQCRLATRVILSSFDAQSDLRAFCSECVEKSRVLRFVAIPSRPVSFDEASIARVREKYHLGDEPYFFLPNQFWAHKNHTLVVRALQQFTDAKKRPLVVATGDTTDYRNRNYFENLMKMVESVGVSDSFRVLGRIAYDDVATLMEHCIAVINPSRSEGWSTSVEEAKSLGKRVLLSDIAVHREQNPQDGLFFDVDDADGLATVMNTTAEEWNPNTEQKRHRLATAQLPTRIRDFGFTYQEIVREALNKDH